MDTAGWADPVVITALLGIFVTLILLLVQMRKIKTQMRSAMYADLIDKDRELAKYLIEHPEVAGTIYGKGHPLYGNDDSDAREIWATVLAADFYENVFVQKYFKTIPKKLWPHWKVDAVEMWATSRAYRSSPLWAALERLYWPEFLQECQKVKKEKSGEGA